MSSYPPGGDYDERLLDSAPKATKAAKQEGYNVNLLDSGNSETPMNARTAPTVDGHASLEAGVPPTKESYDSSYSLPWYRQKKGRIIILVVAIIIIGAVVGGAVGGTLASKNNDNSNSGPSTVTLPTSTSSSSIFNAPAESSADVPPPPGGGSSSTLPEPTSSGAGAVTGTGLLGPPSPTPITGNNFNGLDGNQGVAPIVGRGLI